MTDLMTWAQPISLKCNSIGGVCTQTSGVVKISCTVAEIIFPFEQYHMTSQLNIKLHSAWIGEYIHLLFPHLLILRGEVQALHLALQPKEQKSHDSLIQVM